MKCTLKIQPTFLKAAKQLDKKYPSLAQDVKSLSEELLNNPKLGVDLGGGLRKISMRITSKGRGKSGGARVISFNVVVSVEETVINLIFLYDKAERSSISKNEILQILQEVELL